MPISSRQGIAIAVLVASGLIATGAVLWGHPTQPSHTDEAEAHDAHHEHQEHSEHQDHEAHDEGPRLLTLTPAQQQAAGIATQAVAAGTLQATHEFQGEIRFNEDRTAHVVPRLAGVIEAVPANLGQQVRAGQLLAVLASPALSEQRSEWLIARKRLDAAQATHARELKLWQDKISAEQDFLQAQTALREAQIAVDNAQQKLQALGASPSSHALSRFELRAPFEGTVVEKHIALGEAVKDDTPVFTVSDLRTVWAEFAVAAQDLAVVRVGQKVIVSSTAFAEQVEGTVSHVGALLGEQTRTARARVTLNNPQGAWRPGLFVTVRALGAPQAAAVVLPASAVQNVQGRSLVFKAVEGGFQPVPVTLGRTDGQQVEVLKGLQAGERVATAVTATLASELGKSSAEHSH